jgi:hypothetical protein
MWRLQLDVDQIKPHTERWILSAICLLTLVLSVPYVQCLGDDTFIYMRVIENFLDSGQIEFNAGEPAYLVTSTTWFYVWTTFTKMLGDIDLARYVLSTMFHGLAFLSTWLVARHLVRNPYLRLIALAIAFLDPFYLRWMWAGWETGMKITMASFSLWALLRLRESSRSREYALTGLLIGLGVLTRPEMIVIVGLGFLYLLTRFPRRGGNIFWYTLGIAAVTVPWMGYAYTVFGWAVPHTIFAKSGTNVDLHYLLTNGFKFAQIVGGPQIVTMIILVISVALRIRSRDSGPPAEGGGTRPMLDWLLVATWAGAISGYLITGSYIASIYTGLFVPALTVALAGAAERLSPGRASAWITSRNAMTLLVLATLLSVGIQSSLFYRYSLFNPQYRDGADARFIDFARKVNELTEPDAEIGLWELGVVGYFSERYIVDFAGLATPEIVTYMRNYDRDFAEHFLADRGNMPMYMVRHYRKGEDQGKDAEISDFFGVAYEPIWSQRIQRIGGGRRAGQYDLCVLYRIIAGRG